MSGRVGITDAARMAAAQAVMGYADNSSTIRLRLVYRRLIEDGRGAPVGASLEPDNESLALAMLILGQPPCELVIGPPSTSVAVSVDGVASLKIGATILPTVDAGADAEVYAVRGYAEAGPMLWELRDVPGLTDRLKAPIELGPLVFEMEGAKR